jgi:hypothetical protein
VSFGEDIKLQHAAGCYTSEQELESVGKTRCFAERRIMFGGIEQLKQKLEEMLRSNDAEWVNTVRVTLDAMYKQFELEQRRGAQLISVATRRAPQRRIFVLGFRAKPAMGGHAVSIRLQESQLLKKGNLSFRSRRELRPMHPQYRLNPAMMNAEIFRAAADVLAATTNLIARCRELRTEGWELIDSLVRCQESKSTRSKSCLRAIHRHKNRSIAA